jgi:hypothetical protein
MTTELIERLQRIEAVLEKLVAQRTVKAWYTTAEVGQIIGRSDYTVREYCRYKRIRAEKRRCGRGRSQEWIISHAELERLQNEGLLPL